MKVYNRWSYCTCQDHTLNPRVINKHIGQLGHIDSLQVNDKLFFCKTQLIFPCLTNSHAELINSSRNWSQPTGTSFTKDAEVVKLLGPPLSIETLLMSQSTFFLASHKRWFNFFVNEKDLFHIFLQKLFRRERPAFHIHYLWSQRSNCWVASQLHYICILKQIPFYNWRIWKRMEKQKLFHS